MSPKAQPAESGVSRVIYVPGFGSCPCVLSVPVCTCPVQGRCGEMLERRVTFSSSSRADHAGRRMDMASCLGRPTRMAASEGMRMTSHFRWFLSTFILLYLMNQVNSQKKGECLRVTERTDCGPVSSLKPLGLGWLKSISLSSSFYIRLVSF